MHRSACQVLMRGIFAVSLVISTSIVSAQSQDEIVNLMDQAQGGDTEAMYTLGQNFHLGLGVPADADEALRWYSKAAQKGHPEACYQMGYANYRGKGIPRNHQNAFAWFQKAAEQSHKPSITYLIKMYKLGQGTARNTDKADLWSEILKDLNAEEPGGNIGLPPPPPPKEDEEEISSSFVEEAATTVSIEEVTQQNHSNSGDWQSQQNPEETIELSASHDGEDNSDRVQADTLTDQTGSENHSLNQLPNNEDQGNPGQLTEALELQESSNTSNQNPNDQTEIGNEANQPSEHSDEQGQVQTDEPQAGGVDNTESEHNQELAAQERPENIIGLRRKPGPRGH